MLLLFILTASISQAQVSVGVSIRIAPPAIPVYTQPACPVDGYMWTPGYWAYGSYGYYWVPGVWVAPPRPGLLWTPGYWGFVDGLYGWHAGYWGVHVGFYGGINYGCGYGGSGFAGGMWQGNVYHYNTAVTNVNTTIVHNTYVNNTVINNNRAINRSSFNGEGGVTARPTALEQSAMRESRVAPTNMQMTHEHTASLDRRQLASANNGHPATMAMKDAAMRQPGPRRPQEMTPHHEMPRPENMERHGGNNHMMAQAPPHNNMQPRMEGHPQQHNDGGHEMHGRPRR